MEEWIRLHAVEIFGALSGFVYLYFSIRQNILLWPFGLLNSLIYIYVYYVSAFYADMSLQFYYVAVSIYGWIHWKKGDTEEGLPVSSVSFQGWLWLIFSGLLLWILLYQLLLLTPTDVPLGDAFTTAYSIVATWMLARKILENWLFWIVVDLVSMILYIYKDLWATAVLFGVYTVVAIIGYNSWKKSMNW